MAALKNIIFDLGGVLLNIDYRKTADAFVQLGYDEFDKMYGQFTADELFTKLETGKVSNDDFYQVLISARKKEVSESDIKSAWNRMLLNWRTESLAFLETLSAIYKIYLLSNTNAIHLEAFNDILRKTNSMESIDHLFTKAYYSHEINFRKPNADIFEFVARDAGILPGETLFIDDSENNIKTAAGLGFKTHLLLAGEQIEGLDFESYQSV